jgi:hypothetical protein
MLHTYLSVTTWLAVDASELHRQHSFSYYLLLLMYIPFVSVFKPILSTRFTCLIQKL